MVIVKTLDRMAYALDHLIKAENTLDSYWKLKDSNIWDECKRCINIQKSNFAAHKNHESVTTDLDPGKKIKKTVSRNDLLKIVTAWVEGFPEYDATRLEALFSCFWCYKTLVCYG